MKDLGTRDSALRSTVLPADRAVQLLRAARTERGHDRSEAIDWAHVLLPGSRAARRLRIERLIEELDWAGADALLARALHERPDDAALLRLSAESLLAQGETEAAASAAQRALERRPEHGATLLTSARIAAARGDVAGAVALAERAGRRLARRDAARALLCALLLDAGHVGRAAGVLGEIVRPGPPLRARVLAAQGRGLEAIEVLEQGLADVTAEPGERTRITLDLLDLLERTGHEARVREIAWAVLAGAQTEPALVLRAAAAAIALGEPAAAIGAVRALRNGPHASRALLVIAVAAASMGRQRLAERALGRLGRTGARPGPAWSADLWRRAAAAEIFRDPVPPHPLRQARPGSILEPLLTWAVEVLATEPAERGALKQMAICLAGVERLRLRAAA